MIKNILYLAIIPVLLASCTKKNTDIAGTIKEAAHQKVFLEQLNVDRTLTIDSTKTDKSGHFSFTTEINSPTFYNIKIGTQIITLLANAKDKIKLSGNIDNLSNNYRVEGSENSLWIKLLNFQLNRTLTSMDSLKKAYEALPEDNARPVRQQELSQAWDTLVRKQIDFSKDFILKHAISPVAYYALYQKFNSSDFILSPERELQSYKIVATSLKAMYPESQYTKAILKHLQQINNNFRAEKLRQFIANSETSLPEIRLTDSRQDTIALSSLKGKYVILDFTVLGNQEGRKHIDEMKKAYNNLKKYGIQIYQVCLDENYTLWREMVRQYGIDWICVWDPEGLQSHVARSWNIQNLPANYIIDPKLEIVGKNLKGERLEERMNDLMKR